MLDEKGDGRVFGRFRIENKLSLSSNYRLSTDVWKGIKDVADSAGERPVVQVRLTLPTRGYLDLAVVSLNDYQGMHPDLTDLRGDLVQPGICQISRLITVDNWLGLRKESQEGAELFWLRNRYSNRPFSLVLMAHDDFVTNAGKLE